MRPPEWGGGGGRLLRGHTAAAVWVLQRGLSPPSHATVGDVASRSRPPITLSGRSEPRHYFDLFLPLRRATAATYATHAMLMWGLTIKATIAQIPKSTHAGQQGLGSHLAPIAHGGVVKLAWLLVSRGPQHHDRCRGVIGAARAPCAQHHAPQSCRAPGGPWLDQAGQGM
jgi:hypothetical protein